MDFEALKELDNGNVGQFLNNLGKYMDQHSRLLKFVLDSAESKSTSDEPLEKIATPEPDKGDIYISCADAERLSGRGRSTLDKLNAEGVIRKRGPKYNKEDIESYINSPRYRGKKNGKRLPENER